MGPELSEDLLTLDLTDFLDTSKPDLLDKSNTPSLAATAAAAACATEGAFDEANELHTLSAASSPVTSGMDDKNFSTALFGSAIDSISSKNDPFDSDTSSSASNIGLAAANEAVRLSTDLPLTLPPGWKFIPIV